MDHSPNFVKAFPLLFWSLLDLSLDSGKDPLVTSFSSSLIYKKKKKGKKKKNGASPTDLDRRI